MDIELVPLSNPQDYFKDDFERAEKLTSAIATEEMKKLPRPLQTLLQVLSELKIDIANETERQELNYEDKCIVDLNNAVEFTRKVLSETANEIKSSSSNYVDSKLELEIKEFLGSDTIYDELPDWILLLRNKSALLRQGLSAQIRSASDRQALQRPSAEVTSVAKIEDAIKSSSEVRARLQSLSLNNFTSFYQERGPSEIVYAEEKCVPADTSKQSSSIDASEVTRANALLRKTVYAYKANEELRRIFREDSLLTCIQSLRARSRDLHYEPFKLIERTDMKEADRKLQNEIKMILETLTVDRTSLDSVLRSIIKICENIKLVGQKQSMTSLSIHVTRWRTLLTDAKSEIDNSLTFKI